MRRGHPGLGGWRGENPRHFRPRNGDSPHFRPPRNYPLLDGPRFPLSGSGGRLHRGTRPYNAHPRHLNDHGPQNYHNRNNYGDVNPQNNARTHDRSHHPQSRNIYHSNLYREPMTFYEDVQNDCHINNMGDVDHRQSINIPHNQDSYGHKKYPMSPWANPPPLLENKKHFYENRSPRKNYHHHEPSDGNAIPVLEYGGHRPPSSDHYGGNLGPMVNNDNSFSRSVDDTVDIVRRRLMNRNDSQQSSEDTGGQSSNDQEVNESICQDTQEEPPTKKRIQRQRHNAKSNCDKMKSKIVHQLFKMDKDKMHKLMDNPSSSTKFEYAISSLITESQNSLNRHLRSVAEKSLYSSSTDFIHNDNNTIYEDTFMKQMQCLLDPQDSVLLEDIKPIVMAELSKVLQLEDFEQRFDGPENQICHYPREEQSNNSCFEPYNYEEYPQERFYEQDQISVSNYDVPEKNNTFEDNSNYEYNHEVEPVESKPLFERRPVRNNDQILERRQSMDSQRQRRSVDNPAEDKFRNEEPVPLFESNAEQFSEDEDPFAELDNQYHVAVDHNFITVDDISCDRNEIIDNIGNNDYMTIKKEIENQIQSIAESPLKLFPTHSTDDHAKQQDNQVKSLDVAKDNSTPLVNPSLPEIKLEQTNQTQEHETQHKEMEKSENSASAKSAAPTHTRKRSIDQRPSHRKEKRKKSESSQAETNIHVSSKDTANNTSDTTSLNVDTFNQSVPKNDSGKEISKDNKKIESADKGYSDKYVKRKETPKKTKESEGSKKRSSSSSSHSIVSPKENITSITSQTPTKSDPKIKLKPIDMFVEQSKKVTIHHSHRNTAITPTATEKKAGVSKVKVSPPIQAVVVTKKPGKPVRRSVAVQVIRKLVAKTTQTFESKCSVSTQFSQTEKKKLLSKLVQTEPQSLVQSTSKSHNAFERMKEIDLEIQVLLQEKFKLYSSLESKDSCSSSMPTLGMTVLNVTPYDESKEGDAVDCEMSADAIVDEFTNIPVEELEQIALESVENDQVEVDNSELEKRSIVKTLQQERRNSESPSRARRNKKSKAPNISLLEQIITDDRPLEDIISLDDLEKPPAKSKKRLPKAKAKKKVTKKPKAVKHNVPSGYDLKECTVVLVKADISTYLNQQPLETAKEDTNPSDIIVIPDFMDEDVIEPAADPLSEAPPGDLPDASQGQEPPLEHQEAEQIEIIEDTVVNDLQFDMLDVSEDIIIGDNCEIKSSEDKELERVAINEEIILDNSQSSCEYAFTDPGQIENVCKTYDYSTDENLRRDSVTVSGHADAVLAVECIENGFIAACLDGNVYHFGGDGQLLCTLRGSNLAVTCLTIVKETHGTIVYTGSLDSRIRYYDLDTGLEKGPECNVLSPIQTMDRAWDTIFVGTRTGFVLQFECKNNMLIPVSTVKFAEQAILALRAMKEGPRKVLLVAARSDDVTVRDAQTGLLLRTLLGAKMTVYTLLFEDGKVYCGTSSHQIHVFDYASGSHTGCHEGGKGTVCLRATGGLLFAGCYDGCVYVYREGEPRPLAQLRGPSPMLLSLAIVGSKIIAGYKDRSLYIWKIPLSILQEMIL